MARQLPFKQWKVSSILTGGTVSKGWTIYSSGSVPAHQHSGKHDKVFNNGTRDVMVAWNPCKISEGFDSHALHVLNNRSDERFDKMLHPG